MEMIVTFERRQILEFLVIFILENCVCYHRQSVFCCRLKGFLCLGFQASWRHLTNTHGLITYAGQITWVDAAFLILGIYSAAIEYLIDVSFARILW